MVRVNSQSTPPAQSLKAQVTRWLKTTDPAKVAAGWLSTFVQIFDRVFSEKLLSWRCFRRSCIASMAAVLVVTLYWAASRPREVLAIFTAGQAVDAALSYIVLTLMLSLLPDYVSLLKSRKLIGWMNRSPRPRRLISGVALDLLGTVTLVALAWHFHLLLKLSVLHGSEYPRGLLFRLPIYLTVMVIFGSFSLSAAPGYTPWGIWPWATLFTAAWATLYAVAGALLILARYLGIGLSGVRWGLDVDGKPIAALGVGSMVVVAVLYLLALLAHWVVKG